MNIEEIDLSSSLSTQQGNQEDVLESPDLHSHSDPQQNSESPLVLERLGHIEDQLAEHERLSEQRANIIDRLHEENQRLKQGELTQALAPIYRDLIRLYDDLSKSARTYSAQDSSQGSIQARDPGHEWRFYAETVLDFLYRYGVNMIDIEQGAPFDGKRHRAVETMPTSDPEMNRRVHNIVRPGFQTDMRLVRPADVCVLQYVPLPMRETIHSDTGGEEE